MTSDVADDLAQQVQIGAGQGAVAANIGDQQVAGEVGGIAVQRGPEIDPGRLGPALEGNILQQLGEPALTQGFRRRHGHRKFPAG